MIIIPLVKQAELPDIVWDHNAGPLENVFRWINRGLIVFSGGTLSMIMLASTAVGLDLQDLGRMLDKEAGLSSLSDLQTVSSSEITNQATNLLWSKLQGIQKENSLSVPLMVFAADPSIDDIMKYVEGLDTPSKPLTPAQILQRDRLEESRRQHQEDMTWKSQVETTRQRERSEESEREQATEKAKLEREERLRGEKSRERLEDLTRKDREKSDLETRERAKLEREDTRHQTQYEREQSSQKAKWEREDKFREEAKEEAARKEEKSRKELLKREKAQMKLEKLRLSGGQKFMSGAGKAAIGVGFAGIIGWIFKSLTDPKSWISRLLRGAGVLGAEQVGKMTSGPSGRARGEGLAPGSKSTNYQAQLEQVINQIFK